MRRKPAIERNLDSISSQILWLYDGEHLTARFSVSTGVKIENFMRLKTKNYIRKIIEIYYNKYFITKFAFKKEKRARNAINN